MTISHQHGKSWPFEEADRLLKRVHNKIPSKGYVLFETGYGPSGLPHIGTFGEVLRTTMVRHAFESMSEGIPTRLIAFSDDMDGLRKVPDNVPQPEMLAQHLGKPLTQVPDPFNTYESFGHHNNAMLRRFLDSFGFQYEFRSSTECYRSGVFDDTLRLVLEHCEEILAIMLPSLREDRRKTYSPFLPICPRTGRVLQVPIEEWDKESISYIDPETGKIVNVPVTGGHCKLQWKVDWAMRWKAFDVDYEMSGKDLIDSVKLSSQICNILKGNPPINLTYELFLDEKGEKISKSKGNGLTIDEWLTYAPPESLGYFMFQAPRRARKLYFDVIPRTVDEYMNALDRYPSQPIEQQLDNPVWHVHTGRPPEDVPPLSYNLLLNLASVCNTDDIDVLWKFVVRYISEAHLHSSPLLKKLVGFAAAYYRDFVKPHKHYRAPLHHERLALEDLLSVLRSLPKQSSSDEIQNQVFEVGKRHPYPDLRAWFATLYEVLLGQKEGPRMGSFIALYGIDETIHLIEDVLLSQESV